MDGKRFYELTSIDLRSIPAGFIASDQTLEGDSRHRLHSLDASLSYRSAKRKVPIRHIKLVIRENGSKWGASLWRFNVFGVPMA
jgi:hypothetical protein